MSNRTTAILIALTASLAAPMALADIADTADGGFAPYKSDSAGATTTTQKLPSVATRQDVNREVGVARRDGTLTMHREDSDASFQQPSGFGGMTREEVKSELKDWEANPVTRDGYREVGGETGWVYLRD